MTVVENLKGRIKEGAVGTLKPVKEEAIEPFRGIWNIGKNVVGAVGDVLREAGLGTIVGAYEDIKETKNPLNIFSRIAQQTRVAISHVLQRSANISHEVHTLANQLQHNVFGSAGTIASVGRNPDNLQPRSVAGITTGDTANITVRRAV